MDKVERWSRVGIIYHLELPEGEIFVSTNELYLSLVIENLLDNANKFTDSGSITLKMRLDKAQSKLRIEVTDTGCGIPPENERKYFCVLSNWMSLHKVTDWVIFKPFNY
mgnify:CR=1 FL=1